MGVRNTLSPHAVSDPGSLAESADPPDEIEPVVVISFAQVVKRVVAGNEAALMVYLAVGRGSMGMRIQGVSEDEEVARLINHSSYLRDSATHIVFPQGTRPEVQGRDQRYTFSTQFATKGRRLARTIYEAQFKAAGTVPPGKVESGSSRTPVGLCRSISYIGLQPRSSGRRFQPAFTSVSYSTS